MRDGHLSGEERERLAAAENDRNLIRTLKSQVNEWQAKHASAQRTIRAMKGAKTKLGKAGRRPQGGDGEGRRGMTVERDPKKPVVWGVQNTMRRLNGRLVPAHDTSKAERYGSRRWIVPEHIKPWNPGQALSSIHEALAHYRADLDFLLLIGAPVVCALVFANAADKAEADGFEQVRLLYWSGREQDYSEIIINVADVIRGTWTSDADAL